MTTWATTARRPGQGLRWWGPSLLLVATAAFLLRLLPVLHGGGLYGRGNYDDGVYYAAASGLVHGLLPYRDVLLLHPPGIVLALAPFAALAGLVGDPTALAVARIGFMLLGALNAVLVGVALRRSGLAAAVVGGLFYAVLFPVVYVEHTTLLEPLATTCLLGAVALAGSAAQTRSRIWASLVAAGFLLGVSSAVKIWGVVPAAAVVAWVLITLGWRRALATAGGVAVGATVICLPFFAAAPGQMWELVVASQLGRPTVGASWAGRAWTIIGLSPFSHTPVGWWLAIAAGILAGCCAAACTSPVGRLCVIVLASMLGVLFTIPAWFLHYAAAAGGPLALVVGAAAGWAATRVRRPVPVLIITGVVLGLLGVSAHADLRLPFGKPFPKAELSAAVTAAQGCVTTDNPISLIELGVLSRNLDRGCPLVADLGGYSYYMQPHRSAFVPRRKNRPWQRAAVHYLRSGDVMIGLRFTRTHGFSKASDATVRSWPVLARSGKVIVRRPVGGPSRPSPLPPLEPGLNK